MKLNEKFQNLSIADLKAVRDYAREKKDLFAALRVEHYSQGMIEASDNALVASVYQETLMLEAESAIDKKISQLFGNLEDDFQSEDSLESVVVQ